MEFFQEWERESETYFLDGNNDKMKIIFNFIFFSLKIVDCFTYHDFLQYKDGIFTFVKGIILFGEIDQDYILELQGNHQDIDTLQSLSEIYSSLEKQPKEQMDITFKIIHMMMLLLLQKDNFFDLRDIMSQEDSNQYQKIEQIMKTVHESCNHYPHLKMSASIKDKYIFFLCSSWKKNSEVSICDVEEPMKIEMSYINPQANEIIMEIVDQFNYKKYINYNLNNQQYSIFRPTTGSYSKCEISFKSSWPLDEFKMTEKYFTFYQSIYNSVLQFMFYETNHTNKYLLQSLQTQLQMINLRIVIEKRQIIQPIDSDSSLLSSQTTNHVNLQQEYSKLNQKLIEWKEKEFKTNIIDYYYFLHPLNILHRPDIISRTDAQWFFKNELILCKNHVFIKHCRFFYKRFCRQESESQSLSSDVLMRQYKKHLSLRRDRSFDIFSGGLLQCRLNMICSHLAQHVNSFLAHILQYNICASFKNLELSNLYMDFDLFEVSVSKDNHESLLTTFITKYKQKCEKEKRLLFQRLLDLPKSKHKKIILKNRETIVYSKNSYSNNMYIYENEMIELEHLRELLRTKFFTSILSISEFFQSLRLTKEIIKVFLLYVYNDFHGKKNFILGKALQEYSTQKIILQNSLHDKNMTKYFQMQKQICKKMNRIYSNYYKNKKILGFLDSSTNEVSSNDTNEVSTNVSIREISI